MCVVEWMGGRRGDHKEKGEMYTQNVYETRFCLPLSLVLKLLYLPKWWAKYDTT